MQLRKTLLVGLVASVLLAGCSSEQDTIVMSPLPEVTSQFTRKPCGINPSVTVSVNTILTFPGMGRIQCLCG